MRLTNKSQLMKYLLLIVSIIGCITFSKAQNSTEQPKYFAQCMLNIDNENTFHQLEQTLRDNPYVSIARLDWSSKRVFLLTKDLTSMTIEQFESWLGESANAASCIQIGLHGTDQINPYPFTNCENN